MNKRPTKKPTARSKKTTAKKQPAKKQPATKTRRVAKTSKPREQDFSDWRPTPESVAFRILGLCLETKGAMAPERIAKKLRTQKNIVRVGFWRLRTAGLLESKRGSRTVTPVGRRYHERVTRSTETRAGRGST